MKYFLSLLALASPIAARANVAIDQLKNVGSDKGPYQAIDQNGQNGLSGVIGVVIQGALGLIGAIFLILMLYAGYNWMTARGEEEKVEKAKETLTRAIIGILIVVGSYAIWAYISSQLFSV